MDPSAPLFIAIPAKKETGAPQHAIACRIWGKPEAARTLVCVHGLTRNSRDFDFLASALAGEGWRVICPDMPGRGQSPPLASPELYANPLYMADILYLLNTLRLPEVYWLGTSMGGIIGMMLAAAAPGRIKALALNDIGCVIPAAGLRRIAAYLGVHTQFATREPAEARLREICVPFGIHEEAHWRHFLDSSIEQAADGTFRYAYDPGIAANFPRGDAIADIDLWPLWEAAANIPVLLLRGESSDILTAATARAMQTKHPRLEYHEIANAGHAPALMAHDQIARIKNWLDGV